MELLTWLFIIGITSPFILAMAVLVSGPGVWPQVQLMFWRTVLFLVTGSPDTPRKNLYSKHSDNARKFADSAISIRDILAVDQGEHDSYRIKVHAKRYQEHVAWSQRSEIWLPTASILSVSRSGPLPTRDDIPFGDTLCNRCARNQHNKCHGADYCDCDCITIDVSDI